MADKKIKVSVVMSVFNHAVGVQKTINSILKQQGVILDFVIIDDGAQKIVKQVLSQYKNDARVQLVEQENQGLTVALINGCRLAKYAYIARVDAGDIAKPERLKKQAYFLNRHLKTVCVTSWVEMVTEEAYPLYDVKLSTKQLQQGLKTTDSRGLIGPLHFSTMFRKSAYIQAGQYRSEFYFAQDFDLWLRMQHVGSFDVIPEVLTIAEFTSNAISGRYREQQEQLKLYAFRSGQLKQQGKNDNAILAMAQAIRPPFKIDDDRYSGISGLYFIACCLLNKNPKAAYIYCLRIIKINPFYIKVYWVMLVALLKSK